MLKWRCAMWHISWLHVSLLWHSSATSQVGDDNWGAPVHKISHYKDMPLHELTATCKWDSAPYADSFGGALLHFYESTEDWASFKGYDLVPERHHEYLPPLNSRHFFGAMDVDKYAPVAKRLQGGTCEIPNSDGSMWVIQRFGPVRSTGNYDWWQFSWDDVFNGKSILHEHPEGYMILNSFSGAVDGAGKTIGLPPVHIHHVHVSPGEKMLQRCTFVEATFTQKCPLPWTVVIEQHGDYQCLEKYGGTKCLLEDLPAGYGKLVTFPMTINGELNDVRPAGSSELEWWYQAAIRYVPWKRKTPGNLHPLSFHYMYSPGRLHLNDQSTMVNTFRAPTDRGTVIWYSGVMDISGTLVRGKLHTHNTVFKEAFLFLATPKQLGMDARFLPQGKSFDVLDPTDIGFKDIDDAKAYVMHNYEKAKLSEGAPRLICSGSTQYESVTFPSGVYDFDRRAHTWCNEWEIKVGEPFVTIGFNVHSGKPPGPHMPDVIPPWLPGHLHWFLHTDSHDDKSHYTRRFYTQDPNVSYHMNIAEMGLFLVNGGVLTRHEWYQIVVGLVFIGMMSFSLAALGGRAAYKRFVGKSE